MSVLLVVEGETDVPVARKVLRLAGWESLVRPIVKRGKGSLDQALRGFNAAAQGSPWFVLRDLDHDAPCPGALVQTLLPEREPLLCLRVAVRSIESWLMADADSLAAYLHVSDARVPVDPEKEEDPKRVMVELARGSTKPSIQKAMLPPRGWSRRTGPGYENCILQYGERHWRADVAQRRSPSLCRAVDALARLRTEWTSRLGGLSS